MKRRKTCILLCGLLLALAALPHAAFAQEQAGPDAFTLAAGNFQVAFAGAPALEVGLAVNLAAGLNQAGDRGLWMLDLSGADVTVLNLMAALENGKVKGYLRNSLGGLPYLVEAPVGVLGAMTQAMLPIGPGTEGEGEFSALLESLQALAKAADDPAYAAALRGKVQLAFETAFGLMPTGEETIVLLGKEQKARKLTGNADFAGLWAALPGIFAADPALQACFEEAVSALNESGVFGRGKTFADLPGMLKENGNDIQIALAEYKAGEDQFRLEIVMTALEKGIESGKMVLLVDHDAGPDASGMAVSMSLAFPGEAEKNISLRLEGANTRQEGGREDRLGLTLETQGEGGGTFALGLETRQEDADSRMVLLAEFIAKAEESAYAASIRYDAKAQEEGGLPAVSGNVAVDVLENGASLMQLTFDTLFRQTSLFEGELLSTDGSLAVLDVTQMTGEQGQVLEEAFDALLNNSLMLVLQVPGLSALLGGEVQ